MSAFFNVEWREILKMCVEIGILAYVIYKILYFVRGARGSSVLAGVVVLNIVLSLLAKALDLAVINWLLEGFWAIIGLAVVVIFNVLLSLFSSHFGWYADISSSGLFGFSEESLDLLDSLDGEKNHLTIYFFSDENSLSLTNYGKYVLGLTGTQIEAHFIGSCVIAIAHPPQAQTIGNPCFLYCRQRLTAVIHRKGFGSAHRSFLLYIIRGCEHRRQFFAVSDRHVGLAAINEISILGLLCHLISPTNCHQLFLVLVALVQSCTKHRLICRAIIDQRKPFGFHDLAIVAPINAARKLLAIGIEGADAILQNGIGGHQKYLADQNDFAEFGIGLVQLPSGNGLASCPQLRRQFLLRKVMLGSDLKDALSKCHSIHSFSCV